MCSQCNGHICKFCGKEFNSGIQLGGHIVLCDNNPNRKRTIRKIRSALDKTINEKNPLIHKSLYCEICGEPYTIDCRQSEWISGTYKKTCSRKCASKLSAKHTDLESRNKKTSETIKKSFNFDRDEKCKPIKTRKCERCGTEFRTSSGAIYCSDECRERSRSENISKSCKGHTGGLRVNSYKQYKSGYYKGIHCDSSYELAFLVYNLDNGVERKRNSVYLEYEYEGRTFKYYPDFEIDGKLYEIKGYESDKDVAKRMQHPEVIQIDKDAISGYIEYASKKYGKNFCDALYERRE